MQVKVQIPRLRANIVHIRYTSFPRRTCMLHLHTYIHETSRATMHRRQPSAVSNSPKPATRAHARRHVGRPSPVGRSRHGGVCVLWDGRPQPLLFFFASRPRQYTLRWPRVTNPSRLVVNGSLRVASGEMER